jgi:excinuclease ABC subunit B
MDVMEGARAGAPMAPKRYAKVAEATAEYGELSAAELHKQVKDLERRMYKHAENLEFEEAARLRDEIRRIEEANMGLAAATG